MSKNYYDSISLEEAELLYNLALSNFEKTKKKYLGVISSSNRKMEEKDVDILVHCLRNILLPVRLEGKVQEEYFASENEELSQKTCYYRINHLIVEMADYLGRFPNTCFSRLHHTFPK